jgi:hypothetical protein
MVIHIRHASIHGKHSSMLCNEKSAIDRLRAWPLRHLGFKVKRFSCLPSGLQFRSY